jgi:hypothetical protein
VSAALDLVEQVRSATGTDVIVELLPTGGILVVDQARFDEAKRTACARAGERRRHLMEQHPEGLLEDQLADLRLMRWAEEEHLLDAPGWASHPAQTKGVRL